MAHFKLPNKNNKNITKQLFRMPLLLFIILLSSHLSSNELPAQMQQEEITRLSSDQQIVTQFATVLTSDQKISSSTLVSGVNQQIIRSLPQGNISSLPQTAIVSDLYQNVGFWMLLFAAIFWIIERHFINDKTFNHWQG
ncbi:MAG: hypothetical protein ACJAU1_000024 [Psychromonas sp.]|jgi:hypothetical protein